jgi:hypothetical protein
VSEPVAHTECEIRVDEEHDLDRAERERARPGQSEYLAHTGVAEVERELVLGATERQLGS